MGYPIEVRLASKNGYHTPAEALAYYKKYSRDYADIHWWNSPNNVKDSDHDNIVNYILGKAARGAGSVNYVGSNKKITLLVNAKNVAWATQGGNPTGVSLELSPHLNAEGYKRIGWLINELFNPENGLFRKSPELRRHSEFWKTQCPGTIDLARLRAESKKWADGKYDITPPAPPPLPPSKAPVIDGWKLWKETEQIYEFNKDTWLFDLSKAKNWDGVTRVKAFSKGQKVTIAGSFHNTYLNRTYYVTRFSFNGKIANGFHPADLEIYVAPRPVPPAPKPPVVPPEVTEPELPETGEPTEEIPSWFKSFISKLINFLASWRKGE